MNQYEQEMIADLQQLADCLKHYTDLAEQALRAKYPTLTAWLELTVKARPISGGGFMVAGEIYATAGAAEEARLTAILLELSKHDQVMTCQ